MIICLSPLFSAKKNIKITITITVKRTFIISLPKEVAFPNINILNENETVEIMIAGTNI